MQPQGTSVTLWGAKTQHCAHETEAQQVPCRRQHPEGATFFQHSQVWARQVASLGGGQQMCSNLPSIRAQAGSFALYFHEPTAVTAPGASADGGQHTAKGCQAQAAPRGFPICAVQKPGSTTQVGGREQASSLAHLVLTPPWEESISLSCTHGPPASSTSTSLEEPKDSDCILFQMTQGVLTGVDHTSHA